MSKDDYKTTLKERSVDPEYKYLKEIFRADIRSSKFSLSFFIILTLALKFLLNVSFSIFIPIILAVWLAGDFVKEVLFKKAKNTQELHNRFFRYIFFETFLLTLIVHLLGGIEWIGGFFYTLNFALPFVILPEKRKNILFFTVTGFYLSLVLLEYFQIIPHHNIFAETGFYRRPTYVLPTFLATIGFFFSFKSLTSSAPEFLKKEIDEALEAKQEALQAYREEEEAKNILEVKVKARTKELEDLAANLEEQIKERTKELQAKMEELEKFNRLAVGREIKMMELKEEIKKLERKKEKDEK